MRICILTHTFPRNKDDFAAPFMDGVASGMVAAGNDVWVLTPFTPGFNRGGDLYKVKTYKYMPFSSWHKLGYSKTLTNDMGVPFIMYVLSPFLYIFGVLALLNLIKREKIDIVNAHWILPNGFIGAIVSVLTGVPVVSTLPGSDVYMVKKNKLFSWMGKFAANVSAAVTSNSPQLLEDLKKIGIKNSNLHAIIYGVDPKKFSPNGSKNNELRKKHSIPSKNTIVLGVGRLVEKKGFKYLVEAAPKVIKSCPDTTFFIVGEGDQRQELEMLIDKNNLSDYFVMPGWVDYKSLVDYYNLADVFILPSVRDSEGNLDDQSVAVVEAMACGKPIVSTNFPGYQIVVKDGLNGFLVDEKDSGKIASALIKLVSSKKLRDNFSQDSRELILNKFTWPAIGRQYTDLFMSLIK